MRRWKGTRRLLKGDLPASGDGLKVTRAGADHALELVRAHRLAEQYLCEFEACRWTPCTRRRSGWSTR